ncbi:MAG: GTP 3',8-cyclase MoaA [Euryarchaeota archaeon]|nr:GTP 3',8-cyclase MoaA [Euryarchaeota archaeon]
MGKGSGRGECTPAMIATAGGAGPLVDPFGRPVDDLRISLTSDCNLACWFCHREGMRPGADIMTADEVESLCEVASDLGIRFLKITGGEPLLRRDIARIVARAAPLFEEVSLVTNGQLLRRNARRLKAAGLTRVNVSLPALTASGYAKATGGRLEPVLDGIREAVAAGLDPVKVNAVVTRRTTDGLDEFIRWAASQGVMVQFIELHAPPGSPPGLLEERIDLADFETRLQGMAVSEERHRLHGRMRFRLARTAVEVTRPQYNPDFCRACKRLRLTHDGLLKPCLMRDDNLVDVLGPLRRGAGRPEISRLFTEAASRRAPFWSQEDVKAAVMQP